MTTDRLPATIKATVRLVLGLKPEAEQARIGELTHGELVALDPGLGMWIRNNLGLWRGNQALLKATRQRHADDASQVLVEAVWQHLQDRRARLH